MKHTEIYIYIYTQIYTAWFSHMGSQHRALIGSIKDVHKGCFPHKSTTFSAEWGRNEASKNLLSSRKSGRASCTQNPSPPLEAAAMGSGKQRASPLKSFCSLWAFFSPLLPYVQELQHLCTKTVTSTGSLCWSSSCPALPSPCSTDPTCPFMCPSDKAGGKTYN